MIESSLTEAPELAVVKCRRCGEVKPKQAGRRVCKECGRAISREGMAAYRKTPRWLNYRKEIVREWSKAYTKTDAYKQKRREDGRRPERQAVKKAWAAKFGAAASASYARSEKGRAKRSEYCSRPEVIAAERARKQTPESKAKTREWWSLYGKEWDKKRYRASLSRKASIEASKKKYRGTKKAKESQRKYYNDIKNTPRYIEREKMRRSGDKFKKAREAYRKTPAFRAKAANRCGRRRAIIKDGSVKDEDIHRLMLGAAQCAYCLVEFSDSVPKTIDHFFPLAKGGLHSFENLRVCCKPCNSKKRCFLPDQWEKRMALLIRLERDRASGKHVTWQQSHPSAMPP